MIGSIARLALLILVIWLIVQIVRRVRPRRRQFETYLDYPRSDRLDLLEVGQTVTFWPARDDKVIYVYNGESDEENLLGQLPGKYFKDVEPVIRRGADYRAVVENFNESNVRLSIDMRPRELPDEFV